ncbi:hypothetical protein [Streptomyces sp. NPDC090021]|uniref:hypothetical protein n=1 Tax=Streptomyces sp. NPDC090021 TaxID=3365919 RepID=UPI00382EFE0B
MTGLTEECEPVRWRCPRATGHGPAERVARRGELVPHQAPFALFRDAPLGAEGGQGKAGHEVRDVGEVGEVAVGGERPEPADGGGLVLVLTADGVAEGEGELHEPEEEGEAGGPGVGPQALGAGGDVVSSGALDRGGEGAQPQMTRRPLSAR